MLVLTRRNKDKICFPQLGITVHFIRVHSGQVKVGVDAPRDVKILRDEIQGKEDAAKLMDRQMSHLPKDVRHGIRNELHQVSVGLHLYKELMAASLMDEAGDVFEQIQDALGRLDQMQVLNSPPKSAGVPQVESPQVTPPSTEDAVGTSETVVLVEDQTNEREMLASVLRLSHHHVITLANGEEVLEYFENHAAPKYLLMDMQMPVCDGATAIRQLQDAGRLDQTQVFAVSGISPEAYGVSVGDTESSVERWFPKPLNPKHLLEAIMTTAS